MILLGVLAIILDLVVLVLDELRVRELKAELRGRTERVAELEDRLMAGSLAELRAFRPVAMPVPTDDDPNGYWTTDHTGLVRQFVEYDEDEG